MLISFITGLRDRISVQDFGLSNIRDAYGLAVGRLSGLVVKILGMGLDA